LGPAGTYALDLVKLAPLPVQPFMHGVLDIEVAQGKPPRRFAARAAVDGRIVGLPPHSIATPWAARQEFALPFSAECHRGT
jgi:hypothetical protein